MGFVSLFMGQNTPTEGENLFLDPLLWPQASFDPHVVKPVFLLDSKNVCFQGLNWPSSGSKLGFVVKVSKNVPLERILKLFWGHKLKP